MEMPDLPDFLKRTRGDKPKPAPLIVTPAVPEQRPDPWAEFKARKKVKARGRIGKMKARMADREAVAQGKRWDVMRGGWR